MTWDTTADHCTVRSSSPGPIPEGTVAIYGGLAAANRSATEVVLVTPDGATATGRCTRRRTGPGSCTFARGTGWLAGFHARLKVSNSGDGVLSWEGTYYFDPTS